MLVLIYGDDHFLIKKQKQKVIKKNNPDNEYEIEEYSLLEKSLESILNNIQTIPFLCDKRILVVNDCYFLTHEKIKQIREINLNLLIKYLENPAEFTYVIFVCPTSKISNRLKITKKMLELTTVLKVSELSYSQLADFIEKYIKNKSAAISQDAIAVIIENLPNSLYVIVNEIDKLLLLSKEINSDLVKNNISDYLQTDIFKLVNYLMKDDVNNFLINYHYLKQRGLEQFALMGLIMSNIVLIRNIIILQQQNYQDNDIIKELKVNPYRLTKIKEYISQFSIEKINKILLHLFDFDYKSKKGMLNKDTAGELALLKLFNLGGG